MPTLALTVPVALSTVGEISRTVPGGRHGRIGPSVSATAGLAGMFTSDASFR